MAETLTEYKKKQFVNKVVELYFPSTVDDLFRADIARCWNEYVKSLAPDAPVNKLFTVYTCFKWTNDDGLQEELFLTGCYAASLPCSAYNYPNLEIDVRKCPSKQLKMTCQMFIENKKKRNKFRSLLSSKLVSINTMNQFKEQLPGFVQFLDDNIVSSDNLPVAIDIDAIAVEIDNKEVV